MTPFEGGIAISATSSVVLNALNVFLYLDEHVHRSASPIVSSHVTILIITKLCRAADCPL
jgi:hypothetical protein